MITVEPGKDFLVPFKTARLQILKALPEWPSSGRPLSLQMASKFQPRKKQSRFSDSGATYPPSYIAKVAFSSSDSSQSHLKQ